MISLIRQRLLNQSTNYLITRTLLTNNQLGIDRYVKNRDLNLNVKINKETLVNNIKNSLENNGFVYTEDLKGFAYLLDTPEDAKLLKDAFIKFAETGDEVRLASFKIGPVISRALYHMDDFETLKELIHNEKTAEYFNLRSSNLVYINFLYKKELYNEVLDFTEKFILKTIEEDQFSRSMHTDNALIIYLAAAIKLPSPETLNRARSLLHKYKEALGKSKTREKESDKNKLRLKQVMLYHLLCAKNEQYSEALESLSEFAGLNHHDFLNAKAAILARLGRMEECSVLINKILDSSLSAPNKPRYLFTETIEIIKNSLEKYPNEELKSKIDSLDQEVILDANIEQTMINLPNITIRQRRPFDNDRMGGGNRFDNRFGNRSQFGDRQFDGNFNRPGFNRQFDSGFNRDGNRFNNDRGFDNRFNRPNFRNGRYNARQSNLESDEFGESSRRSFRPFQTRFKEETSDII